MVNTDKQIGNIMSMVNIWDEESKNSVERVCRMLVLERWSLWDDDILAETGMIRGGQVKT